MHGSVVIGKDLVKAYYSQAAKYSYYSGCSTGGRQGLKEIQMFPDDFDGAFVGAPAWWVVHLGLWTSVANLPNLPQNSSHHISSTLASAITDEIIRQCDPQDGVTDNVVMEPYSCRFNPNTLLCSPSSNTTNCLQPAQMTTLHKALNDWVDDGQTFVFPAPALGASISNWLGDSATPSSMGTGYIQNMLLNTTAAYDWTAFNYSMVQLSEAVDPGRATPDAYDLSAFRARGGKLLHYHGMADPVVPFGSSLYFYDQVAQAMVPKGVDVDDFYRFFPIAGMGHCDTSGYAPYYIAGCTQYLTGATHGVPGFDGAEHDGILALMRWVENGTAPEKLVATKYQDDMPAKGVESQRPVCPYPLQTKYKGGEVADPASWACESLY